MFRPPALFCFAAIFAISTAIAQDAAEYVKPQPIKPTPEILALFAESLQAAEKVEPTTRAGTLFRLLDFSSQFEDKTTAKKIIDILMALAPSLEMEDVRNEIYAALSQFHCDMEQYSEAAAVLQRIAEPADRCQPQLRLACQIIFEHEENKMLKPFDATGLLRQAITGAVESKNEGLEGIARAWMGRELARQGKLAEAAALFDEALKTAQKMGQQGRGIVAAVLQCQVKYDLIDDAQATLKTPEDPQIKEALPGLFARFLFEFGKFDEVEKFIKTLPADEDRDALIHGYTQENMKTITEAKVRELSALISSDTSREQFLLTVAALLQKGNRTDTALQVSKHLKEPEGAKMALFIGKVDSMLDENKFAEAIKFLEDSKEEESIRHHLMRQILTRQFNETHDDSVAAKMAELHTSAEKISIAELRETANQALKNPSVDDRMDILAEIFQNQCKIMDIAGSKQTLKLIGGQLDKETDPVKIVQFRLFLSRFQLEAGDKAGVKENLAKLMQTLAAVKDIKDLKSLLPEQETAAGEPAIQHELFRVYWSIAMLLVRADAAAESKAAFAKALELARLESDAARKAEKLLILADFMAEQKPQ